MRLLSLALALSLSAAPLAAQGLFTPRAYVNNAAVTEFELQQRMRFMEVLGAAGDVEKQALDALIDDRLYQAAGKAANVTVTDAQITQGITEFAGRANISPEEFSARMRQAGVEEQTIRDFVRAGLLWREVVRSRFGGKVHVTDSEVTRAMQAESRRPSMEIALSEIILPTVEPYRDQSLQIADLIEREVHGPDLFAEAARRFSAARSRENGGALEWMPANRLPPSIAGQVNRLSPGQVSQRVEVPNAIAFFLLRGRREGARPDPASLTVDYAELRLPAADAQKLAVTIAASATTCDDLYPLVRGSGAVARQSATVRALPADVALDLASLDPGEITTRPTADGGLRLLMLCSRMPQYDEPPTRDEVRSQLLDQKIGGLAQNYLAQLRADAIIRRP